MICINCGAEISDDAKFCEECGQKVEKRLTCPVCGAVVNGGNFCPECGAPLSADIASADPVKRKNDLYIQRSRKLKNARIYAIREMYTEAKKIYDELLKDNPADMDVYMGYIRIATKNYTAYDGAEIDKSIRMAQSICGKEDLSEFDRDYAAFIENADWNFAEKYGCGEKLFRFAQVNDIKDGKLVRYNGTGGDVVIPKGITTIGKMSFHKCKTVKTIKLSEGVTTIEKLAFRECTALTAIKIPSSVTAIDVGAFSLCTALKSITVDPANRYFKSVDGILYRNDGKVLLKYPAGRTAESFAIDKNVVKIGDYAFMECNALVKVTIPHSVITIGELAFCNCKALKDVYLPDSVITIKEDAFNGCLALTYANIPSGVTTIGAGIYSNCPSLVSIYVDADNSCFKSVDGVLFSYDGKTLLRYPSGRRGESYKIPSGVTTIGDNSFDYSRKLSYVEIPEGVTAIGQSAFSWCNSLTDFKIPEGVTEIGPWAFLDCNSLRNIVVPASVRSIGCRAFACCENLTIYMRCKRSDGIDKSWADDGPEVVWDYWGW